MKYFETKVIRVEQLSLTSLQEVGFDPSDEGKEAQQTLSRLSSHEMLNVLTKRQREVAVMLGIKGFSRSQIAKKLGIKPRAVHKLIWRMRKRILLKEQIWTEQY